MTKTASSLETTPTPVQRSSRLVRSLGTELDQLFSEMGLRQRFPFAWFDADRTPGIWAPVVEVEERGTDFFIRAELPGLTKEDVKVEVTQEAIILEGERKQETVKEEKGYYRSERSYGQFRRMIAIPEGADPNSAVATFKDGILEVGLHMNPKPTPDVRRLEIG